MNNSCCSFQYVKTIILYGLVKVCDMIYKVDFALNYIGKL